MSNEIITMGFAAVYLLTLPWFMRTAGTFNNFAFKVAPTLIGAALALQAYGKWMGWPI